MCDEASRLVNNISPTALADLNLRDDVPNEGEIHLPNDNAILRSNAGHGYRHIRLRLVDEINRPIVNFIDHRLNERRLLRMIGMTCDDIRRFARHAVLFSSHRIELHELGQCRHLAQQANRIKLPFIQCAVAQGQLGFPYQSGRDVVEELADLVRRGFCLLALNANQKILLLVVREPDIGHAIDRQSETNDGDEHDDIFSK